MKNTFFTFVIIIASCPLYAQEGNFSTVAINYANPNGQGLTIFNSNNSAYSTLQVNGSTGYNVPNWANSMVFESVPVSTGGFVLSSYTGDITFQTNNRNNRMTITSNGNVGIGTTTPSTKLEIVGQVNSKYNSTDEYWLRHTDLSDNMIAGLKRQGNSLLIRAYDGIGFSVNNTENPALNISQGGNVGIGITSPAEKLAVNGKIRAHEIKVETANWPDYVFAKDYKLPTLQETERHIKEKGHLPGIPSATEVKANGVDLGEMNTKLLQKIEELTLHLIRQQKEIEQLKKRK